MTPEIHHGDHLAERRLSTSEVKLERWQTRFFKVWATIGTVVLLVAGALAVSRISSALVPFLMAFLLVFLLRAPVAWLARRGIARGAAVGICYLGALAALTVAGIFIFPPLGRQIASFADEAPRYIDQVQQLVITLQDRFSSIVVPDWLNQAVRSISSSLTNLVVSVGDALAQGLLAAGGGVATFVFDLFIAFVIAYWVLKDLPKMRDEITVLAGRRYEDDVENLIETLVRVVGGYLRGQTIASAVTGTIAAIGLAIVGVPYALVLGIITLIFNYIPYIGPWLAGIVAALVALIEGPWTAVFAILVVILAQQLTDNLVTPRVMSAQVDLHPTLVIFSLLVGGSLFGLVGMIVAIPVAATGKGLFVYYFERKTRRSLVSEDGALFKASAADEEPGGSEAAATAESASAATPSARSPREGDPASHDIEKHDE